MNKSKLLNLTLKQVKEEFKKLTVEYKNESDSFCYDCEDIKGCSLCYKTFNVSDSCSAPRCTYSIHLLNCKFCDHCLFCYGLLSKNYCILNTQLTEYEYNTFLNKLKGRE